MHSLSNTWEHMKIHLIHNVHINSMKNAMHHLELEEERLHFSKFLQKCTWQALVSKVVKEQNTNIKLEIK